MAVSVTFGGTPGTGVTVNSDTELTVTTPAGTGLVDLTVTTAGGADTLDDAFTYQVPGPTITTVAPHPIAESRVNVRVNGTGFTPGPAGSSTYRVQFDTGPGTTVVVGPLAPIGSVTATGLTVLVDAVLEGLVADQVLDLVVLDGTTEVARLTGGATVSPALTPTLTNFAPTAVTAGASKTYTATGTGFIAGGGASTSIQWRVQFFPTGTTTGATNVSTGSTASATQLQFLSSLQPPTAGVWDAYVTTGGAATGGDLDERYTTLKWTGTVTAT